jgi:5-aminopentanamidase
VDETIIAVAQLAIAIGEPDANRKAAAAVVAEAAAAGARLVVLPELCDSGYVFGDDAGRASAEAGALASPADDSATLRQWRALAAEHRLVIVGGFCERGAGGRLFNSAAVVDASGTRAVYRKAHLWDKEKLVFTPGDAPPPVVDLGFGRIGVMICYDLEFPEWVRLPSLAGADLVAAPVNWPAAAYPAGERPAEVIKAQAAAAANGVFVAVADRCQDERGVSWISGSLIAGPDGYPLAGPVLEDRPALLTAACDLPRARDKGLAGDNDLLADRRAVHAIAAGCRPCARRASTGGERPLGGALRRQRHQLLRLHADHGPHHGLGRVVPRVGPHGPALRGAGRHGGSGRARGHCRGGLAARRVVLALGQVRLRRSPGRAAGGARAHRGLLPAWRRHPEPARGAGARSLRRDLPDDPGGVPEGAGPGRPVPRSDHDARAGLGERGAAGDCRVHAGPWPRDHRG